MVIMLIYEGGTPHGGVAEYKSAHKRKRASIQVKALKTKRRHTARRKKKVKKSKKRRAKKGIKLNAKNTKFLKKLGFRVKN